MGILRLALVFVLLLTLVPVFAQVSIDDKGIANIFSIYSVGDRYVVLSLDSSNHVLLGVLDSNLTPLKAYNLTIIGIVESSDTVWSWIGVDYGYVWFYNETGYTVDALYYNVTSDKFYRFYTNVTASKPPVFDLEVVDAEAAEYIAALGVVGGGYANTNAIQLMYIVKSLEGVSAVLNVTIDLGFAFSASYEFSTVPAVLVEKDVVYFAFAAPFKDVPAVFYGYYNVSSLSGKLYVANSSYVARYGTLVFYDAYTYMVKDGDLLHIVAIDGSYGTLWYVVVNASDMTVLDSKIIKVYGGTEPVEASARWFSGYMVIPVVYSHLFGASERGYLAALLLDTSGKKVYVVAPPVGFWGVMAIPESVGGVGFYINGSVYLVRPTSVRDYVRGVYKDVIVYNATDGVDDADVTVGDYSTAISAASISAEHGLAEVTLPSAAAFSVSLEPITYYPKTVTKTVSEPVPVPVEVTKTTTVTTTVEKPVVGTDALIAMLFIVLIVAAVLIMRRR